MQREAYDEDELLLLCNNNSNCCPSDVYEIPRTAVEVPI